MFLFSKSIIPEDSKVLDRDLGHVLWKLTILIDLGENLHAALDWEVMFLTEFSTWKLKLPERNKYEKMLYIILYLLLFYIIFENKH